MASDHAVGAVAAEHVIGLDHVPAPGLEVVEVHDQAARPVLYRPHVDDLDVPAEADQRPVHRARETFQGGLVEHVGLRIAVHTGGVITRELREDPGRGRPI